MRSEMKDTINLCVGFILVGLCIFVCSSVLYYILDSTIEIDKPTIIEYYPKYYDGCYFAERLIYNKTLNSPSTLYDNCTMMCRKLGDD